MKDIENGALRSGDPNGQKRVSFGPQICTPFAERSENNKQKQLVESIRKEDGNELNAKGLVN